MENKKKKTILTFITSKFVEIIAVILVLVIYGFYVHFMLNEGEDDTNIGP